jgi:sterol desaturase/sphingolipid hydroxylase (fatty acid hydroxylase superfamily)
MSIAAVFHLIDLRTALVVALIFIPLERVLPNRPGQKVLRRHWPNDLVYLLFNNIPVSIGLFAVIAALMAVMRQYLPESIGSTVRSQPLWLQAIEVVAIADTGFYLAHRAFHAIPFLWRFHAVHHSIEEMDWLAAHRVHPVDQILTKAGSYLPVLALGFSDAAVAIIAVIYFWQSLLIHSNVRVNFGPLKWIVASPQFHHWHHANEPAAINKNFAGQLPLIDVLAGTLFMPERMPTAYGTDEPVPALYHRQLVFPIAVKRAARGPDVVAGRSPR